MNEGITIQITANPSENQKQCEIEEYELYKTYKNSINTLLQMGFSLRASLLCVQIAKSDDIDTLMQFALANDEGRYTHPFLEIGNDVQRCIICDDVQSKHDTSDDPKAFEDAQKLSNECAWMIF